MARAVRNHLDCDVGSVRHHADDRCASSTARMSIGPEKWYGFEPPEVSLNRKKKLQVLTLRFHHGAP